MARLGRELGGLIEPVRDLAVGRLLQEIARALERGARVQHEPIIRGPDGRIVREGALHLPRRADLAVTEGGETRIEYVETREKLDFVPLTLDPLEGCVAVIAPFHWDAAQLRVEIDGPRLDFTPIRRWFLEAFQSRYGELAPDLDGVAHALIGPRQLGPVCHFRADLGSAPVDAVAEMLEAFARSGAKTLRIGNGQGIAEHVGPA